MSSEDRRGFGREVGVFVQLALLASWGPGGGQIYETLFPGFQSGIDERLEKAKENQLKQKEEQLGRS